VKAMNKEDDGLIYIRHKCPRISEAKMKEGIFFGPQLKQLFQGPDFRNQLNSADIGTWETFENVCSNFLGS
jgi:hypothetical protein